MPVRLAVAVGFLILAGLSHSALGASDEGWSALDELREELVGGTPVVAEFTQTFTPSGFSEGDVESGTLALDLPECARWDYDEPFPKSFLLCGKVAYTWNPGESSGRRYEFDRREAEGIDLLRLDVAELRQRFDATVANEGSVVRVHLSPADEGGLVREATLTLTGDHRRLLAVAWLDREGNHTIFEIGKQSSIETGKGVFEPPSIEWLEN